LAHNPGSLKRSVAKKETYPFLELKRADRGTYFEIMRKSLHVLGALLMAACSGDAETIGAPSLGVGGGGSPAAGGHGGSVAEQGSGGTSGTSASGGMSAAGTTVISDAALPVTDATSPRTDAAIPAEASTMVPGIIGVGYGGIRIVTRDLGKTWSNRASFAVDGVDDENLLRAVVYGKGLWIATGWKLVISSDGGVTWTDHGMINKLPAPRPPCNIIEGLAFKDGTFYGACPQGADIGTVFKSTDGLAWTKAGEIGNTGGHLYMNYRGNKFYAYGDTKTSFVSDDAVTWTQLAGVDQAGYCNDAIKSRAECGDASWFNGVFLQPQWKAKILRSTDGTKYQQTYLDDQQNSLYQGRAFAEGFVAP
jgi:hypothetical protein